MKPNPTSTSSSSSRSSLPTSSSSGLLPATSSSPLVSSTIPPASEEPSPTDLLLATPPTLLKLFALLAPFVSIATRFCQLVTWQDSNFFASLLVLLGWWGICLFGKWLAVYGFNLGILIFILSRYFSTATKQVNGKSTSSTTTSTISTSSRHSSRPPTLTPAAYSQLLTSSHFLFSHLHSFRTSVLHPLSLNFSFTPTRPSTPAPAYQTAKILITSYPFYLILTYLVPLRYIFLTLGSIAILWQAPFFKTFRKLVWKSGTIRWLVRITVSICLKGGQGFKQEWRKTNNGVGLPGLLGKKKYRTDSSSNNNKSSNISSSSSGGGVIQVEEKVVKTSSIIKKPISTQEMVEDVKKEIVKEDLLAEVEEEEESEGEDVEVQFTVFENQRWWVGLDWTHALLPGERASWTDPSSNPSNPPSSFNLPQPQITYIPSPTSTDPLSRLKKTTSWRWIDPEWKVLRQSLPFVTLPVSPALPPTSAGESPPSPTITTTTTNNSSSSSIFSSLPSPPANLLSNSLSSSSVLPHSSPTSFSSPASLISDPHSKMFENWSVDGEGWQYGDNHFEKMGPKGGLGKYTRRRAWVRRAGLVETTERVSGSPTVANVVEKDKDKEERGRKNTTTTTTTTMSTTTGGGFVEKLRRKSESRHSSSSGGGESGVSTTTGTKSAGLARKRKSMPPTIGSEQSISKDVD
ncbi:hypothetical protein JCM3765_007307 [Sporobolomyces pararoseus]